MNFFKKRPLVLPPCPSRWIKGGFLFPSLRFNLGEAELELVPAFFHEFVSFVEEIRLVSIEDDSFFRSSINHTFLIHWRMDDPSI